MKKPFIYGFGPFDEFETNVTAEIIAALPANLRARSHVFDVVFDHQMFENILGAMQPTHILGLGQTRQGVKLRIESRAANSMATRNAVARPIDLKGEQHLDLQSWDLPLQEYCEQSVDAGTYVCNFSMWISERWARRHGAQFAFVHVPLSFNRETALKYLVSLLNECT